MIFGVQEFCFAILFEILFVPDVKTDSYIAIRDGFELEFFDSSELELQRFRAESSRAGALQFSS